jgi:Zn-dependent protease with chaperone function
MRLDNGLYLRFKWTSCSMVILLGIFILSGNALPAETSVAGELEDRLEKKLVGKELYLRERINSSPKVYCTITDSSEMFFIQEEGRLLNLGNKVKVRISGVKHYKARKRIKVEFKHERLGKGSINFYWVRAASPDMESFQEMAGLAFCETEANDGTVLYVGNRESGKIHFIGCNHLPEPRLQERFFDVGRAIAQGYSMCGLCFGKELVLPDIDLEDRMCSMVTSQLLSSYRVCPYDSINDLVNRLGEKVLNNWPTRLRGYKYSFTVLESDLINACAAPGGKIFVFRRLLDIVESENELIGILAHEITHIERRHAIRDYYKRKKKSFWIALAAMGLGLAVDHATDDSFIAAWTTESFLDMAVLAAKIAMSGYSRECEIEADYYAIAFLKTLGDNGSYGKIMRKLQYSHDVRRHVWRRGDAFATHPDADLRVDFANNARIGVYPANTVFIGCNKEGDEVAEIRFEAQCVSRGDLPVPKEPVTISNFHQDEFQRYKTVEGLKVFATLSATVELGEISEIKEIKIKCGSAVHKLDNREDTRLFPMHEIGCTFESDSGELLGEIDGIELKLRNVEYWKKM